MSAEYQKSWSTTYGLLSVSHSNGKVTHACCRFCKAFGTEGKARAQRGHITQHTQFTPKWRTDNFISHLKNIHPKMCEAYKHRTKRATFFEQAVPSSGTLDFHFPSEQPLQYSVSRAIVDVIMMLLIVDDDNPTCDLFQECLEIHEF